MLDHVNNWLPSIIGINRDLAPYQSPGRPKPRLISRQALVQLGEDVPLRSGDKRIILEQLNNRTGGYSSDGRGGFVWLGQQFEMPLASVDIKNSMGLDPTWRKAIYADPSRRLNHRSIRKLGEIALTPVIDQDHIFTTDRNRHVLGWNLTLSDLTTQDEVSTILGGNDNADTSVIPVQLPSQKDAPLVVLQTGTLAIPIRVKGFIFYANPPRTNLSLLTLSMTARLSENIGDTVAEGTSHGSIIFPDMPSVIGGERREMII